MKFDCLVCGRILEGVADQDLMQMVPDASECENPNCYPRNVVSLAHNGKQTEVDETKLRWHDTG
jgi:hypothetical protein